MPEIATIDANFICQIARANGLDLSLERAEALLPAVRDLLAVDTQIANLHLQALPAIGETWEPRGLTDDK